MRAPTPRLPNDNCSPMRATIRTKSERAMSDTQSIADHWMADIDGLLVCYRINVALRLALHISSMTDAERLRSGERFLSLGSGFMEIFRSGAQALLFSIEAHANRNSGCGDAQNAVDRRRTN